MQVRDTLEILGVLSLLLTAFYGLADLRVNMVKRRQGTAPSKGVLISARTLIFVSLTALFFIAAVIAAYTIGSS